MAESKRKKKIKEAVLAVRIIRFSLGLAEASGLRGRSPRRIAM
jgi:hypothetical protein